MAIRSHPGSLQHQPSAIRQFVYFWLTRWPRLYLLLEASRPRGNWDKRVYLSFVKSGDTVLDIGANFGSHTILFSHLVGARGKVLSFEPVPASFEALRETVAVRARFSNIELLKYAIGNPRRGDERAFVNVPGGDFGQASLRVQAAGSWEHNPEIHRYPVTLIALDAVEEVAKLGKINFVKIDVEGGELDAIKGAQRTLKAHLPALYCELYDKWTASFGYTPADLIRFVQSLGYTHARVLSKGKIHRLVLGETPQAGWFDASSDVIFFSERRFAAADRFDRRFRRWLVSA